MTDRRVLDDAVKAIIREVAREAAIEAGKMALEEAKPKPQRVTVGDIFSNPRGWMK